MTLALSSTAGSDGRWTGIHRTPWVFACLTGIPSPAPPSRSACEAHRVTEPATATAHALPSPLDRRLVFVTGKGGVGKTTVSAALGVLAARHDRRTIVAELARRDDVGRVLGDGADGQHAGAVFAE